MKNPEILYRLIGVFAFAFLVIFLVIEFVKAKNATGFDGNLFYFNLETMAKMIGALVGFVIGIEIEQKYVKFTNHKNLIRNIIRFVLGIVIIFVIRIALKEIFSLILPTDNLADQPGFAIIAIILDFLRYFMMVVVGIGVYPLLFKKFSF